MNEEGINIYSMNTNGLGQSVKRRSVFRKLKHKKRAVFLLQETHSTPNTEVIWKTQWGSRNIIFSHGSSNSKGVAILCSPDLDIEFSKIKTDNDGRYIILEVKVNERKYTVCNLYFPTRDHQQEQIKVLESFCNDINDSNHDMNNIILGGDFNVYLNPLIDKLDSMPDTNDNFTFRQNLVSTLETFNLTDIWRNKNPLLRYFTWHRGYSRSRLDYFFISDHLANVLNKIEILPGIHSDHSLLYLSLNSNVTENKGKGFWKFNSSLLSDVNYVKHVKDIIKNAGNNYSTIDDKRVMWELIKLEVRSFTVPYSVKKREN